MKRQQTYKKRKHTLSRQPNDALSSAANLADVEEGSNQTKRSKLVRHSSEPDLNESGRKRQRTRSSSHSEGRSVETARDELERTIKLSSKTSHANLPKSSNPIKTPLPASSPPRPLRPAQTRAHASAKSPRFGHRRRLTVYNDQMSQPADVPPPTPLVDSFAKAGLQSPLPRSESHAQILLHDLDNNLHAANIPPIFRRPSIDQSMSSIILTQEDVAMDEPITLPEHTLPNRILPFEFNFDPLPEVEVHRRSHSQLQPVSSPSTNEHADRRSPSPDRPLLPPTSAPRLTTLKPRIKPRLYRRQRHESSSSSNARGGASDDELASQFGPLALQDDEDRFREKVKRRVGEGGRKSEGLKGKTTLRMKILPEARMNPDETSSDPLAQFVMDDQ